MISKYFYYKQVFECLIDIEILSMKNIEIYSPEDKCIEYEIKDNDMEQHVVSQFGLNEIQDNDNNKI